MKKQLIILVMLLCSRYALAAEALVVWYNEQEAGTEAGLMRYIITERYLRSDDGTSENGFVLLDRTKKTIYNVVPESRTIMVIDGRGGRPGQPDWLEISETAHTDPDAPLFARRSTREIQVLANRQPCYSAVVAPGMYSDAGRAMHEFREVLAVQSARTLANTPEDMQSGCFLTLNLYAPGRHLLQGLPIREWNENGRSAQLVDLGVQEVDMSLFKLPEDYRAFSPPSGPSQ